MNMQKLSVNKACAGMMAVFVLLCAAVFVGLICRKLTLFSGYNRDENGNPHQVSFRFNVKEGAGEEMGAGCAAKHQHDGKTTEAHAVI